MDEFIRNAHNSLKKYIGLPIVIGIVASVIYVYKFGWDMYFKDLLSWTIGITLVSIVLSYFLKDS